jgi:hypothetical protein
MVKRILAVAFIFACTSIAWFILGGTITYRTSESGNHLRGRVESVWGSPQVQSAPFALDSHAIHPSASEIYAGLQVEPRQKGLLWYSTYKVVFHGEFEFQNPDEQPRLLRLTLPFLAAKAVYDDLQFLVDGQPVTPVIDKEKAYTMVALAPKESLRLSVGYRSQGLESWKYSFGEDVSAVQDFHLRMTTNFRDIDFPDNTLAGGNWTGTTRTCCRVTRSR